MVADASVQPLIDRAKEVLAVNDLGGWTKPAPALYPHQWNWDSGFIAIGLSHYAWQRAQDEILSLLRGQWRNGLVPQIVFNPDATGYFPGPDVWQSTRSPEAPRDVQTSGITQPPVLSTAALAVYRNSPDREAARSFLDRIYPHLYAYHEFFYRDRNPDGDGLIVVLHPWESGLDNSPPYLDAGRDVRMTSRPHYTRLDTQHVNAAQRPTDKDYDLFVYLLEAMRHDNYDQHAYIEHAPLQVQDVLFNSILCRANDDLAEIAGIIGRDAGSLPEWSGATRAAVNRDLWSEEDNTYFSRDRVSGRLLKDDTIASFITLFGKIATDERAERLVEIRLRNPRMYSSPYPVPTTALDSSWFNPESYWLGPVWVGTNWLVIRGLLAYGYTDLAARLSRHTVELVQRFGFHEYFNPLTGAGYGTDQFSWGAALTLDLLAGMGIAVG